MSKMLIYVTVPTLAKARLMARDLLAERLIACANILPPMVSLYEWQGRITEASEVLMLCKTTAALAPAVIAAVEVSHSDECPGVLVLPIEGGSAGFLDWIDQQTSGAVL